MRQQIESELRAEYSSSGVALDKETLAKVRARGAERAAVYCFLYLWDFCWRSCVSATFNVHQLQNT